MVKKNYESNVGIVMLMPAVINADGYSADGGHDNDENTSMGCRLTAD